MDERPALALGLDYRTFEKYYYLKEELAAFCRDAGLPASGNKQELTERVACFLESGKSLEPVRICRAKSVVGEIIPEQLVGEHFVCSERHRAFFRGIIGTSFSFTVVFQRWLKTHPRSTYAEAVEAWYELKKEKKPVEIDRQFEYNTYIRDFFRDNAGRGLQDAICCWKYKKSLPGAHRYERNDLCALLHTSEDMEE